MYFIIFKMLNARTKKKQGDISSIVDESLVHCHGGSEIESCHRIFFIYLSNCLNIIYNQFLIILVAEYQIVHILLS